jgi:hypothetical protein
VTAEFSHQVHHRASEIGACFLKNPVLAACKIIIPTPNFPKRELKTEIKKETHEQRGKAGVGRKSICAADGRRQRR